MTAPAAHMTTAGKLRAGQNLVVDPLDPEGEVWSIADVSRSQYADATELVLYRHGKLAELRLMNDQPVVTVPDRAVR